MGNIFDFLQIFIDLNLFGFLELISLVTSKIQNTSSSTFEDESDRKYFFHKILLLARFSFHKIDGSILIRNVQLGVPNHGGHW